MLEAVVKSFQEDRAMMIEAPTGTGKTLAYLLPAIIFSRATGEKVAVSTHVKSLQSQLVRDLNDLQENLSIPFKFQQLKGVTNYICLRDLFFAYLDLLSQVEHAAGLLQRAGSPLYAVEHAAGLLQRAGSPLYAVEHAAGLLQRAGSPLYAVEHAAGLPERAGSPLYADFDELLCFFYLFSYATRDSSEGSFDELSYWFESNFPEFKEIKSKINADFESCTKEECGYFNQCFLYKARRLAMSADILVLNHALLLSKDWEKENVPKFHRLIIAENKRRHRSRGAFG